MVEVFQEGDNSVKNQVHAFVALAALGIGLVAGSVGTSLALHQRVQEVQKEAAAIKAEAELTKQETTRALREAADILEGVNKTLRELREGFGNPDVDVPEPPPPPKPIQEKDFPKVSV